MMDALKGNPKMRALVRGLCVEVRRAFPMLELRRGSEQKCG